MNQNKKSSNRIVGIDLGTTNSCISVMEGQQTKVLENPDGSRTTPSVVSFDNKENRFLVGITAKRQAAINPESIFSIKRKMGTSEKVNLGGKQLTPEQVSAEILRYLVSFAEEKLGEKINRAVITVPAYFNDVQRKATENAGKIAGLKVERIINEPTAAALAYGLDKKNRKEQKILVYDLGGGTFDVSILQISNTEEGGVFEVLKTTGINNLGGDDFDQRISDYLIKEFKKEKGVDLSAGYQDEKERKITLQRILEASQQAKHELSAKSVANVSLPYIASRNNQTYHLEATLTRSQFNELTRDLIKKTADKVDEILKEAKLNKNDIEQVVLVGGSTRMNAVEELIKDRFGEKKINKSVNPDEVVAIGAAIQAAVLTGEVKDVLLLDVTPLSLGIEVEGGLNDVIIPRNSTIPVEESRVYSTASDNQTSVHIRVLQGERARAIDNKILGNFELSGIDAAPRGMPKIEVKFSIDSNGMVSVIAKDQKTNKEKSIKITGNENLTEEEIARMVKEAEENREKDEEFRKNSELINQAQSYYFTLNSQIEQFQKSEGFNEEDQAYKAIKEFCDSLKKSIDEKDYAEINNLVEKMQEMMKFSSELMNKMPNQNSNSEGSNDEGEILDVDNQDKENE